MSVWDAIQADLARLRQVPTATYRLQFNRTFTFKDAQAQIPYLKALGISHIYASPYFRARPDSMHGYDICDHNSLNPAIGSEEEYQEFVRTLHEHGMGQILDTVPNHMGIAQAGNEYWQDVLENGPSSPYATWFDIDWQPLKQEMANQVLLPILGAQYGQVLENQELQLSYSGGAFFLSYYETQLPLAPGTYLQILELVHEIAQEQEAAENSRLELQSIMTALSHLPSRTEIDPEKSAERQREKEIIKRRLNALSESDATMAEAISRATEIYNGTPGDARSFDRLDGLVRAQAYRLAYWRVAAEEINYRRFFDINDLAAIRMEQPDVFAGTHKLILRLLTDGSVNGLRIDHPDGLWDPARYFRNLQLHTILTLARQHFDGDDDSWEEIEPQLIEQYHAAYRDDPHSLAARPLYVVVEKILGHNESLPNAWPVDGTSGYEFLNLVNGLFVDSANAKAFDAIYHKFYADQTNFTDLIMAKKRQVMLIALVSEINVLSNQLSRIAERNRYMRDFTLNALRFALREVIACFPIYRTYIADGVVPPGEKQYIETAISCAKKRSQVTDPSIFDFIRDVLLLRYPGTADEEDRRMQQDWVQKFQQVTGPVMAKGLEDTAFYIYNRLISLNEVGGEPQQFGTDVTTFHRANQERLKRWTHTMLTTSTHDTKRSEDVRARIDVLSELPKEWRGALSRWSRFNRKHKTKVGGRSAPDRNEEYLLYQTLLGAWPFEEMNEQTHAEFVGRMQEYMLKALKEAKTNTSWVNPNQEWDAAVSTFVARILENTPANAFLADFRVFAAKIAHYGVFNALSQTLLKLTAPGVPDIYQGNETWDLSLVDPDNRRPVDYARHAAMLKSLDERTRAESADMAAFARELLANKADGCVKLYLTERTLRLRRESPALFAEGSYVSLEAQGAHAEQVIAFARRHEDAEIIVVAPRLVTRLASEDGAPLGDAWGGDLLVLPDAEPGTTYRQLFTNQRITIGEQNGQRGLQLASVFADLPVALLIKESSHDQSMAR
ncbi:MAG: malto-oligosyltrehalose synthase [Chloroflexi bacterium]|nr:malto-oligosyltrehalose synthase [Chloroflexota bacterium]